MRAAMGGGTAFRLHLHIETTWNCSRFMVRSSRSMSKQHNTLRVRKKTKTDASTEPTAGDFLHMHGQQVRV
jgi:hypothetical protein